MALRECPDCKEQVSDAAPACPKCGKPMKPKQKLTKKHYIIIAVVALVGLSFLSARHPGTSGGANENATQGAPAKAPDKNTAKLRKRLEKQLAEAKEGGVHASATAVQIYDQYNANEVAADAKYRDKWVQVTGKLQSVAKDITDDPYLVLAADSYGIAQVHAALYDVQIKGVVDNSYEACTVVEKAATLKSGQKITVECLGKGSVIGMPRLEQCIIIPDQSK